MFKAYINKRTKSNSHDLLVSLVSLSMISVFLLIMKLIFIYLLFGCFT